MKVFAEREDGGTDLIGDMDLDAAQLRTLLDLHITQPGKPGQEIEVLSVNVATLATFIGQDAAERLEAAGAFKSAAALSRALGYQSNDVSIALKKAERQVDWPTLRGVTFRTSKDN